METHWRILIYDGAWSFAGKRPSWSSVEMALITPVLPSKGGHSQSHIGVLGSVGAICWSQGHLAKLSYPNLKIKVIPMRISSII